MIAIYNNVVVVHIVNNFSIRQYIWRVHCEGR